MKKTICLLVLSTCSLWILAQTSDIIRSSRPGQSFTPYSVGKNVFQIQSGVNFNGFDETNSNEDGNGVFFVALARYGITETIEIRSEFQFNRDQTNMGADKEVLDGFSGWNIGMRFNVLNPELLELLLQSYSLRHSVFDVRCSKFYLNCLTKYLIIASFLVPKVGIKSAADIANKCFSRDCNLN